MTQKSDSVQQPRMDTATSKERPGIYVHIPFCHSKCAYCDFYSSPALGRMEVVVDCIIREYAMRRDEVSHAVRTIYIGGGTPSILPISLLERLVKALPTSGLEEFTIEANPEDVNPEVVAQWRNLGIDRVSMGVQSLIDSELKLIGRRHSAVQAIEVVEALRAGGISNISLDLIYGLPTQTLESWRYSLCRLLDLKPEHFSAYALSYEPRTRLTAMLEAGRITPVDEDVVADMYESLTDEARSRGYEHYEISNFALPCRRAVHNSSYWSGTPYLGLGPAAHSFDGKLRRVNPSSSSQYINAIESGAPAYEIERETRSDRFNDLVITRMRTVEGIDFTQVPVGHRLHLLREAYPHIQNGNITIDGDHLRIPEARWLLSDAIMRDLIL